VKLKPLLPPRKLREHVVHLITMTFDTDDFESVREAARIVTDHYKLKQPIRITARRRMKPRTLAGLCWEDGRIDIIRPSVWKEEERPRAAWVATVLHEFGHAVLWADAETKADLFANEWLRDTAA
jgi:hypothetical protein